MTILPLGCTILHLLSCSPLSLDARTISEQLRDGRVTAVELMSETLDRIQAVNPQFNAVVSLAKREDLIEQARIADNTPRKGWLHGIPFAVKDLSHVKGFPTTLGGSPLCDPHEHATRSEPFVERLINAGAIIIGKTNTPENGIGSNTYNALFGSTPNPYNTDLTAGGSSGGAAVAVATGMLPVADGTDMMGSLRNPAGWNHLYSLRPTAGRLEYQHCPRNSLEYPISTAGPVARNVDDLTALYHTMVGSDPQETEQSQEEWSVGWLGDWELPFEDGIIELCRGALRAFQNAQPELVTVQDIDEVLFGEQYFWSSWTTIRSAIVSHGAIDAYGEEALLGTSSRVREELQWEVQRGLEITPDDLENAHDLAKQFSSVMEGALSEHDALALPSAQVWPFPTSCKWPRQIASVDMDTYHRWMQVAIPASLAGLPAVTVPAGFNEEGLPMGIQLIGRKGGDELLLQLARLYQNTLSFCVEPYNNL